MRVLIRKEGCYLIASVQVSLNDNELIQLMEDLIMRVKKEHAKGVIIDITVLDIIDSFATRILRDMTNKIRLNGASTVIVGIQPEVAFALVQLGLNLGNILTAFNIDEGISLLNDIADK